MNLACSVIVIATASPRPIVIILTVIVTPATANAIVVVILVSPSRSSDAERAPFLVVGRANKGQDARREQGETEDKRDHAGDEVVQGELRDAEAEVGQSEDDGADAIADGAGCGAGDTLHADEDESGGEQADE